MKGTLTISRQSTGKVVLRVRDEASRIVFCEISTTPETLAEMLMGLAEQEVDLLVKGLAYVGKTKIVESRSIACPISYDREAQEQWLLEHAQEPGWTVNPYLGSQGSTSRDGDVTVLNYTVFKYE